MSDIKKLLEHIDEINASTSSKKQLSEAGWTPNEAQRKWLGGADINDPFIIARLPARLGPKPGIPNLPPADQEIARQFNRGVDNANRIRSFFGLKTGDDQSASQPSAPASKSTTSLPSRSISSTTDAQSQPQPGTTRPGLRVPFQLPDDKVDIVPSEVKTQTGIRQQAVPIELNEIEMDESGLQAYLGNKKYGKEGMDALRKAGRDGASKEKMAKIRAKYDKLDEEGVAEGYSDVVKGVKRSLKGKEHPDVVASKHAGRAIGHYNQGDIAAGDKETERYKKIRNMHLKAKGVAEGSSDDLVYISVDRVEAFEDWMDSEGLETNVPKTDEGTYVVYDYSNADYRSKMYASDWNEKKGVTEVMPSTPPARVKKKPITPFGKQSNQPVASDEDEKSLKDKINYYAQKVHDAYDDIESEKYHKLSLQARAKLKALRKQGVAEGFKNTYNVGDRVDSPLGTGTIVAVSKNINVDGRVKVKLDDPSRAGEDGKYKDSFVLDTIQLKHISEQGVAEDVTQRSAANRLTRKFENYLTNKFEMLESGYGSEKKKFKVEAAPTYPNAQDPNAQTTSPQPPTAQATKDEQDKKREQQVDIATAKGTMAGLKNVLGPNLDINQAASAVTKINDGKPLTGPEQQAMSAITPLLAKAAEMPQTASNLKTSLTNAAYLAKLGK